MDAIHVQETTWRGLPAWLFAGDSLELIIMKIGAHIAGIRIPGEQLNPLWQPPWAACFPEDALHKPELYGQPPDGPLLSALVGHNLCIDRFGPPWPGENRSTHGEAGITPWTPSQAAAGTVVLSTFLPEANLHLTRSFGVEAGTAEVTTTVRNAAGSPTEIEWAEHVTIGDPFLENAKISAGVDAAWISSLDPAPTWRFPGVLAEEPVDATDALSMPPPSDLTVAGDIITSRVSDGWFRVDRPDLGRRLEYTWVPDDFPWLCIWTQHRSRTETPWNGVTRAKGLEFSTKPFPEGKPPSERAAEFHGCPTICAIGPNETIAREFSIRWSRI
jgi:hypothetical protein